MPTMSKTRRYRGIATLPYLSVLIQYATAQQHLAIDWSKEIYGPDGPWNAVSVQVGGVENETPIALQQVTVDLYPGSTWTSFIPTNVSCNTYGSVCGKGSSWISDTAANGGEKFFSSYKPGFDDTNSGAEFEGSIAPQAITLGGQTVYQADMVNFGRDSGDKTYVTYPSGVKAFPHLGVLALNAGPNQKAMAQDFPLSTTNSTPKYSSAWIPAGSLYSQSVIPSYSYGLHYGSAALNYSGSLYLGGYDKGRVIGPYTIYSSRNPVLMDITIGVETGDSPLPFHNKTGLLEVGDAKQIEVEIVPHSPSLYLPPQTCEGLAKVLPIYYDRITRYYLWNTSDPLYEQLITSPAYLGFVFPPAPGSSDNVNIKIPFRLLNLTLTSPIVSSPIQYFPCQATTPSADTGFKYALGRAFLQGAFVGWNTKTNLGWLAQAPGPGVAGLGLGIEGKDIEDDATELDVYDGTKKDYFAQSWANHWTPINAKKTSGLANDTTSDASSTGNASNVDENKPSGRHGISLSIGAIVGIAAGGAVLAVVIASALVFCILRRRRQRKTVKVVQFDRRSLWPKTPDDIAMEPPRRTRTPPPPFSQYPSDPHREPYHHFAEMPGQREIQELYSSHRFELEQPEVQELHPQPRFEMGRHSRYELGLPPTPHPRQ
ncbi:hypothetical protein D6D15_00947 [Aureobasidium pullulans]|uniref:Peptidase A1 domain-containing protein n=1 Tax=Aureobasidium pullulans TaxID=5580 RepID=A0A4S9BU84_AURPU|nr:hypothetical protein D6D15_00947 [Aureobasidium pullulans]